MHKSLTRSIAFLAATVLLAWGAYQWFFCRFYVAPGYMAIVTAKTGATPAGDHILVKRGEKGIWEEVLPEGRHFLDPIAYDWEIVPALTIPLGKIGIVTAKVGRELPAGEIIAANRDCKGIWRDVLGPGTYRLNPLGYNVRIDDAINIPIGYVGIVTAQTGTPAAPGHFAQINEKGVLQDILQPGLYYLNPLAYQINIIEIGMNQVSMERKDDKDGSLVTTKNRIESADTAMNAIQYNALNSQLEKRLLNNDSTDTIEVQKLVRHNEKPGVRTLRTKKSPSRASEKDKMTLAPQSKAERAVARLQQADQVTDFAAQNELQQVANAAVFGVSRLVEFPSRDGFKIRIEMTLEFELLPEHISKLYLTYGDLPQVVEKIIMPQVLSVSRLKGSSYRAQDFIIGGGRETFQNDLKKELLEVLADKYVLVHNAIIRNVEIPDEILQPIRTASLAQEQNLTNASLQETAKMEALLNTEVALINQKKSEVAQETKKLVAEIAANREKAVAKIKAQTELEVAALHLKKSEILARSQQVKGEAAVKARYLVENEKAQGTALRAQALGSGAALAETALVDNLSPALQTRIIYAGDGTLWTDLKNGTLSVNGQK